MPRYTDGSSISVWNEREVNYDLILSPSNQFRGAWMEGNFNNNVNPYSDSRLYLLAKKPLVKSSNFVEIKIYSDNGIKAYCGHPAYDDNKSINATASGEAFILTSNIVGRPAHTLQQPLMGDACKANGYCYQRGTCDYCTGKCTCNEGWGGATDTIMTGRDISPNCFTRKYRNVSHSLCHTITYRKCTNVSPRNLNHHYRSLFLRLAGTCPSGKAISDLPTSATEAHAIAECSNAGTCDRRTGQCKCFSPYTGAACQRCTFFCCCMRYPFAQNFILSSHSTFVLLSARWQ